MDGILLFNKPILWTSHDAVDFVRRRIGQRAVGHAGTLDPMATGLLLLLLGRATKHSAEWSGLDKDYEGTITLGIATDTQDLEGRILRTGSEDAVREDDVHPVFSELHGEQTQIPPIFSAVHTKGRRLYDWARRGLAVQAPARRIWVRRFELVTFRLPELHFFMSCSKGTYVRSLCDRVGERLGCGAVLSCLVRTRIGPMHLADALEEGDLRWMKSLDIERHLRSPNLSLPG